MVIIEDSKEDGGDGESGKKLKLKLGRIEN